MEMVRVSERYIAIYRMGWICAQEDAEEYDKFYTRERERLISILVVSVQEKTMYSLNVIPFFLLIRQTSPAITQQDL